MSSGVVFDEEDLKCVPLRGFQEQKWKTPRKIPLLSSVNIQAHLKEGVTAEEQIAAV